jgi:predicted small lipoprotein YifL
MRAAAPGRAIVAGLTILAGCALGGSLAGCGQRGSLYLPTVPPMPAPPAHRTQTQPASESGTDTGTVPDTSGTPLSLSPELATPPASAASGTAAPLPASAVTPVQ